MNFKYKSVNIFKYKSLNVNDKDFFLRNTCIFPLKLFTV